MNGYALLSISRYIRGLKIYVKKALANGFMTIQSSARGEIRLGRFARLRQTERLVQMHFGSMVSNIAI